MCDNPINASYLCALIITQLKRADNSINCDNSINFDGESLLEHTYTFIKVYSVVLSDINFYKSICVLKKTDQKRSGCPNPGNLYRRKKKRGSVLPRLRFCAIVAQNFEYDAPKTVPAGHLAHINFGLSQDFESVGIPVVVTAILIGVLDF